MKKIILSFLIAAAFLGVSSCEEPPKKKETKKTDRHYRDNFRYREDRNHQEKRW